MLKRLMDIIFSGSALLILLPFLLGVAILVKLTSPGPALFRQIRLGKDRKEFSIIKFRSMIVGAEKTGQLFTIRNDKRITSFGKFLRKSKIDELPELWNVFIGDMSLVGPRPMVAEHVIDYKKDWERIFSIRPGITDLATLQYNNEDQILSDSTKDNSYYSRILTPRKVQLSLDYIDSYSLGLDIRILFRTVWLISFGRLFTK
jgi:lipopolysaccharide/colanic/teichoic acid biosynthesis glycosyltransferase